MKVIIDYGDKTASIMKQLEDVWQDYPQFTVSGMISDIADKANRMGWETIEIKLMNFNSIDVYRKDDKCPARTFNVGFVSAAHEYTIRDPFGG